MSDLTREEKIASLSKWCVNHACNSIRCRIYDICHQYPGSWDEQSDENIDKVFEKLWGDENKVIKYLKDEMKRQMVEESSSHSPVVVDKTYEEELRQDLKKEEAEANTFDGDKVKVSRLSKDYISEPQCEIKLEGTKTQEAKADAGKAEIRLVPMEIVWAIAWIRMYGNRKYGDPENWKTVEPERYRDALMRHLLAYISDHKSVDEESGYPHLWHAACNMAFLMHLDYGEEVLHDKQPR